MPRTAHRWNRALAVVALVLAAGGAAGCGGGNAPGPADPAPVPGSPGPSGDSSDEFRTLVVSVCTQTTRGIPSVPGPGASEATAERYVSAVRTATRALAADLGRLADQRPASAAALRGMAGRTAAVATVAASTPDGRATGGAANDLAVAVARMNQAATAAELPECGL